MPIVINELPNKMDVIRKIETIPSMVRST
jgi:hypothetical protein